MMLIGQYDSPFVRRVGIALTLWGQAYEHAPWSTFGDADKIARYNPLRRVPTLVLDDGLVLVDSAAILDILDEQVGPDRALHPRSGPARAEALRIAAFAAGAADKGVSLLYERALRDAPLALWADRCQAQVGGTLALLEAWRAQRPDPFAFGTQIGHADIMLATMLKFLEEALPGVFDLAAFPALAAHSARCEALPAFQAVYQPYRLAPPPES